MRLRENEEFCVFIQDGVGPFWQGTFASLREAEVQAQQITESETTESFVFSLERFREVQRF